MTTTGTEGEMKAMHDAIRGYVAEEKGGAAAGEDGDKMNCFYSSHC